MITPEIPQLDPMRVQTRKHALLNEISSKPSRRWWRIAVPATVLAAAALVAAAMVRPSTSPAFASWSAEPRAPGGAAVVAVCPGVADSVQVPEDVSENPQPLEKIRGVQDYRGDTVLVVSGGIGRADGTGPFEFTVCLQTPEFTKTATLTREGPFGQWFQTTALETDGKVARTLFGRVGEHVHRVVVETADGKQVTATLRWGWVAAWWPSKADAKSVTMYDQEGKVLGTTVPDNR